VRLLVADAPSVLASFLLLPPFGVATQLVNNAALSDPSEPRGRTGQVEGGMCAWRCE
jgi:hypothetical protein